MAAEIHVGDVGTSFRVTVVDEEGAAVNLSDADTLQVWFALPDDGGVLTRESIAVGDGSDGRMEYISASGDLSVPGRWKMQGYVEIDGKSLHSEIYKFKVFANLK